MVSLAHMVYQPWDGQAVLSRGRARQRLGRCGGKVIVDALVARFWGYGC